ncbi:MAG: hypothetical protein GC208_05145 [Alphaproteobacteria bacterium]|nr:hypothetical protein [Alphaproteobacteria bacterium]
MIIIAMAAALLMQEEQVLTPEELVETLDTMMGDLTEMSDELEEDDGSESTARSLVRLSETVFENSPFEVFALRDRDDVIARITPAMDALINFEGEHDGDYSLDYAVNAFRNREGQSDEYPFCMAGSPDTIVDEPTTDPDGNVLNIRICSYGRQGEEEGELIGSYIYQINNGIYYVQYRGGVSGTNEAGIRERLVNIEGLIEPLVRHTVIARGEQEPQPALDAE